MVTNRPEQVGGQWTQLDLDAGGFSQSALLPTALLSAKDQISLHLLFDSKLSKWCRMDVITTFISLCLRALMLQNPWRGWLGVGWGLLLLRSGDFSPEVSRSFVPPMKSARRQGKICFLAAVPVLFQKTDAVLGMHRD